MKFRWSKRTLYFCTSLWLCMLCIQTITGYFCPITVISETACSYWLLYAALLSDRWCWYKLIGCWNKWHACCSETHLGQQCLLSAGLSRAETDQFTLLQFSLQLFRHVVNLWSKLDLRDCVNKQNKMEAGAKTWSRVASKGVQCYSYFDFQKMPTSVLMGITKEKKSYNDTKL